MPRAGGVVILRSPLGRSRLSVNLARAACRALAPPQGEKPSALKGRQAAETGRRYRLPVGLVGDIAGRKQAGYRGRGRVRRHLDIARRLKLDLAENQIGRGRVPDRDEDAV